MKKDSEKQAARPGFKVAVFYLSLVLLSIPAFSGAAVKAGTDTSVSVEIRKQLGGFKSAGVLHYPETIKRFYRQCFFQPVWVTDKGDAKRTWEAVLMLNCVLQFGLCHADYHPAEINYTGLHLLLEHPQKVNNNEKARYELMITDALITFINHLHYGKLNPFISPSRIDDGADTTFRAGKVLARALRQPNFMSAVLSVQPVSKAYSELEEHMRTITQYQEDCYSAPDSSIQKMAINLDRLRWIPGSTGSHIQLNIPSYTLTLYKPDTTFEFKAIVGGPATPTAILNSAITDFTTASKLKMPGKSNEPAGTINPRGVIYFWFRNNYGLCINGRPEKDIFTSTERAQSKGGIKVEQAKKLAKLLLETDGRINELKGLDEAIAAYGIKNFILSNPIQFSVTYITCEVKNNIFINYTDIYSLDKKSELALYNAEGN